MLASSCGAGGLFLAGTMPANSLAGKMPANSLAGTMPASSCGAEVAYFVRNCPLHGPACNSGPPRLNPHGFSKHTLMSHLWRCADKGNILWQVRCQRILLAQWPFWLIADPQPTRGPHVHTLERGLQVCPRLLTFRNVRFSVPIKILKKIKQ